MNKIKVLYIEDEKIVGDAVLNYLREDDSFNIGELVTGDILDEHDELIEHLIYELPDVLLLDIDLNDVPDGGLKILKAINQEDRLKDIKVLVLSTRYKLSESLLIKEILTEGVSGFIGKNAEWEKLVNAIHLINQGQKNIFSKSIINIIASSFDETIPEDQNPYFSNRNSSYKYNNLTKKEKEVFAIICQGIDKKKKLSILDIVTKTYDGHWSKIKEKLDLKNEIQCLLYALENNIDVGLKNWD